MVVFCVPFALLLTQSHCMPSHCRTDMELMISKL